MARRIRQACCQPVPIIDYVSPSVWAWRSGTALRKCVLMSTMYSPCCRSSRRSHQAALEGPDCTYVGHPLIEKTRLDASGLNPDDLATSAWPDRVICPVLVVLPGSRSQRGQERLMAPFTVETLDAGDQRQSDQSEVVIPVVELGAPRLVEEADGQRLAGAARIPRRGRRWRSIRPSGLPARPWPTSGTVTLELWRWLGTPMVVAYKLEQNGLQPSSALF